MTHSITSSTGGTRKYEGKVIAGGAETRRLLSWLMGLDAPGTPFIVKAVAWIENEVKATVSLGKGREGTIRIQQRTEQTQGVVKTENLCVSHTGDQLPQQFVRLLETVAPKRLGRVDISYLAQKIAADPDLSGKSGPLPGAAEHENRPRFLLDTWGNEGNAFADFFAGGELARGQLDSLDPTGLFVFVQHSDAECNFVNPHGIAPIVSLVNYPWDERMRSGRKPPPSLLMGDESQGQMLSTDLNEQDVIMGSTEKVARALKKGVEISQKLGKTLFFSNTCVPTVTGEDVESMVKHCQAGCNCPLFYLTVTPRSMTNVFRDVLVTKRLASEETFGNVDSPRINLLGMAENSSHAELVELLELAGIQVNISLLPNLEISRVHNFGNANLNVFQLNSTWQHMYDQLLIDTKMRSITPPPPFGVEGSREWLSAVSQALPQSMERDIEGAWQKFWSPWDAQWQEAKTQAQGLRLGLVLRARETHYLTRPEHTWGIPLVQLLEEMGFSLDLLVLMENRDQAAKASREIQTTFRFPERHTLKGFNSLEMMLDRIRTSETNAILTYHFFDWRITQGSKNLFSLQHIEAGPLGALRTIKRLTNISTTPFFKKYGSYLKRDNEGFRVNPQENRS